MKQITIEKALKLDDIIIVDTRSPAEFETDHILNAINIPIFDNLERKEIGTLYKADQDEAFNLGMDYYSKKLPDLTKTVKKLERKTVVVYCWRGGTRSKAMTQLFDLLNFDVYQLEGGYKGYRNHVIDSLAKTQTKFVVLWGNTGAAKTKLLEKISNKIDLEGLAQHRGSLFGGVGLKRQSQKFFETLLFFELKQLPNTIFVEGESRKIGNLEVPQQVYKQIQKGINVHIKCKLEARVNNIVIEYFQPQYLEEIKNIIPHLKERMGKQAVEQMLKWMDEKNYSEITKMLLVDYYDPLYKHTLNEKNYTHTVNSEDQEACVKELIKLFNIK